LAELRLEAGDTVYLTKTPGGIELTARDPELETRMELSGAIMRERRDVLRELAT